MRSGQALLAGVVLGIAVVQCVGIGLDGAASARPSGPESSGPRDLDEQARIYDQDQGDRMRVGGKPLDWSVVAPRDRQREARVKRGLRDHRSNSLG